jgi:arylsulfatase A-like enzyme
MVRWPGKIPAGVVTQEMLSAHDWYAVAARLDETRAAAKDQVRTNGRNVYRLSGDRVTVGQ